MKKIKELLRRKVVVLDGATGTELQKRGMPVGVSPELWCLEHRDVIAEIHRAYREAGSDVVYTCTFGANRQKLMEYGFRDVATVNRELAEVARRAVGSGGLVAGDIGPTGRFVEPFGDLPFEEAVEIFKEQAKGLMEGGVDLFVIETMMDIQEARAALLAVKELGDYFTIVTMTFEKDGRTLGGTDPITALVTLQSLGADAVGCNCSVGPREMISWIEGMFPYARVPLIAKPNAGLPRLEDRRTVFEMGPEEFGSYVKAFIERGVSILGGCCGTGPEHIAALSRNLKDLSPPSPKPYRVGVLSSARSHCVVGETRNTPLVIGERINPTGKKDLQEELRAGKMDMVRRLAREQVLQGADLLDINVGVPGIDEAGVIGDVIKAVVAVTDVPLVIDTKDTKALERALRIYPGRALVNSITGEEAKMRELLPLASKYGAMFILLPIADGEVPDRFERRREVIKSVLKEARRFGFRKEDILVDGLVTTVATHSLGVLETLKTVEWCRRVLKCQTVLGVSNVSFGMPERRWLNTALMALAMKHGISAAIINPGSPEVMGVKRALDVLLGYDPGGRIYVGCYSGKGERRGVSEQFGPEEGLKQAIIEGDREGVVDRIKELLDGGYGAANVVQKIMIPAIVEVGERFERREFFLPQLVSAAEAMERGMTYIGPFLEKGEAQSKGKVILATVKGDIHDIGKNIVALMLRNHGYRVIDLGKDVPTELIVKRIKDESPLAVGLSALMTTTMTVMREVIQRTRSEGFDIPFLLGGAVVTEEYARSLGAFYGRDGVDAVRILDTLRRKDEKEVKK
ncbi:MAG: homocysteine S-methyltransferase family protein [Syntrophales bacterium]|nr:homocysteine S-methyltransferase family protein [Syntrophales bacterium]